MGRISIILTAAIVILIQACGGGNSGSGTAGNSPEPRVKQQPDGTISLNVAKADCYSDADDPSGNTAEWNVLVSKSGRYEVWISSATTDTTDLKYEKPVLVSIHDYRIQAKPGCDRIVQNSNDVSRPYFRADSFLGSMYIQDTGLFNVQVISEKILPQAGSESSGTEIAKLLSVSFKPETR